MIALNLKIHKKTASVKIVLHIGPQNWPHLIKNTNLSINLSKNPDHLIYFPSIFLIKPQHICLYFKD